MSAQSRHHTPGPWRIERNKLRGKANYLMAGNYAVAMLFEGYDAAEANGRLLAAAPALLEACRQAAEALSEDYCPDTQNKIRAAIAAATTHGAGNG